MLSAAGLLNQRDAPNSASLVEGEGKGKESSKYIRLIDVGFGCGDQSLYLTRKLHRRKIQEDPSSINDGEHNMTESNEEFRPLFDSYVGINITPSQVETARKRLFTAAEGEGTFSSTPKVDVFAADAGDPASWDTEIREAIYYPGAGPDDTKPETQTWLLALDTLYHLKPSRMSLFQCAYQDMQASIMAFDLLLSDSASYWDKFYLRLICLVAGMPYSNFMTTSEYKAMLALAGYEEDSIEMQDISEHVFTGIADFIRTKEADLGRYGMTVGKFKGPASIFDWWGRSGVVRGCVIVAHR